MEVVMILYAAAIPLVPLWGFDYFKKRQERGRQTVCFCLFLVQLVISGSAVYFKFFA